MPSAGYLRRQADICLPPRPDRIGRGGVGAAVGDPPRLSTTTIHHDYKAKADAMDAEAEAPADAIGQPHASRGAEKHGSG
jgi:hypothetical protein